MSHCDLLMISHQFNRVFCSSQQMEWFCAIGLSHVWRISDNNFISKPQAVTLVQWYNLVIPAIFLCNWWWINTLFWFVWYIYIYIIIHIYYRCYIFWIYMMLYHVVLYPSAILNIWLIFSSNTRSYCNVFSSSYW